MKRFLFFLLVCCLTAHACAPVATVSDRASTCARAVDHLRACLGGEYPVGELNCDDDQGYAAAQEALAMSCGELMAMSTRGLGNLFCSRLFYTLGICRPDIPAFDCGSELGTRVAEAVHYSNHAIGLVPYLQLFTNRNRAYTPWVDAPEMFRNMADLIASARYEVDLETFEWDPWEYDKEGDWEIDSTMVLIDGLERLQDRLQYEVASYQNPHLPVKVHIIVNGRHRNAPENVGGLATNKIRRLVRQLKNADLDPRFVEVHPAVHEYMAWGAMHSKVLIVDGYKAVVTGANPQKFNTFGIHWHDVAFPVFGEIGIAMQHDFDDTWRRSSEVLSCDLSKLDQDAECVLRSNGRLAHPEPVARPDLDLDPAFYQGDCVPMIAATRRPYSIWYGSPLSTDNPQDAAFLALMDHAKEVIKIESPNLNATAAKKAILRAVGRGVEVRVILSLGFNAWAERMSVGPIEVAGGANVDTVLSLYSSLDDPESCDRLQIRWNAKRNGQPSWVQEAYSSHTKYLSADGTVVMVGSANQDTVSWYLIQETNVVIDDETVTAAYDAAVFDADWQRAGATDVLEWARKIRDGETEVSDDLSHLLYGNPGKWASEVLAACGR